MRKILSLVLILMVVLSGCGGRNLPDTCTLEEAKEYNNTLHEDPNTDIEEMQHIDMQTLANMTNRESAESYLDMFIGNWIVVDNISLLNLPDINTFTIDYMLETQTLYLIFGDYPANMVAMGYDAYAGYLMRDSDETEHRYYIIGGYGWYMNPLNSSNVTSDTQIPQETTVPVTPTPEPTPSELILTDKNTYPEDPSLLPYCDLYDTTNAEAYEWLNDHLNSWVHIGSATMAMSNANTGDTPYIWVYIGGDSYQSGDKTTSATMVVIGPNYEAVWPLLDFNQPDLYGYLDIADNGQFILYNTMMYENLSSDPVVDTADTESYTIDDIEANPQRFLYEHEGEYVTITDAHILDFSTDHAYTYEFINIYFASETEMYKFNIDDYITFTARVEADPIYGDVCFMDAQVIS